MIEQLETYFRIFFAVTVSTAISNVGDFIMLVILLSVLNWLAGYRADAVKGKKYSHKKTMKAVKEMALTSAILFFVALTCTIVRTYGQLLDSYQGAYMSICYYIRAEYNPKFAYHTAL